MTTLSSEEIIDVMDRARFDPAGQQRRFLDLVEARSNGEVSFVDPGNPFMLLLEAALSTSSNALTFMEVLTRKRYVSLAQTREDIYLHMSDRDYLGIFAMPPVAPIGIMVSMEEVRAYAVEVTSGGMRKLVLPKNSNFTVDGHTFTLEYPIEFRIMPHGGLSVVYGNPINGALHEVSSNMLTWDTVDLEGTQMIRVFTQMHQMKITSEVFQTNAAQVFNTRIGFTDQFHHARAYVRQTVNGVVSWKNVVTTHTDQVFDPNVPTVLLKVYDGVLDVHVPLVYRSAGTIDGELRLDIYSTKAINDKILAEYDPGAWTIVWEDLDDEESGRYTAPFSLLSTYTVYSDGYTSGARAALTLDELRDRVSEHNAGEIVQPITSINHQRVMSDKGYSSVTDVDAITKRILNATRAMPVPLDRYTVTPISAATETMVVRLADLNGIEGSSHNGDRVTLHPSVLYKNDNGGVTIVDRMEKEELFLLKPEATARAISAANYRFSPFHNVLDASSGSFAMRTYYLDSPEVTARQFVDENPSTQLELQAAKTITINRTEEGYQIHLITNSGKSYQDLEDDQVHVQLAYTPPGETSRAFLNGNIITKSDGERVWEFNLITNYDIDSEHSLTLTNFSMFSDGMLPHAIGLKPTFEIIYLVSNYTVTNMAESTIDTVKNKTMLPFTSIGVLQERLTVTLGDPLEYLWTGSRTIPTPADYEIYADDIPLFYESPVFERDASGELIIRSENGSLQATVLHNTGDPVLDGSGVQVYKHRAGDLVLNESGEKVLKTARQLARQVDLTLFDGRYYFANDASTVNYKRQLCNSMRVWSNDEMGTANQQALEKTKLYFRPLTTTGQMEVIVGEGADVAIDAEQSLKVIVLMTETGWKNEDLKRNIRISIISIIATAFSKESIATKDIVSSISEQTGGDVLGIDFYGLGGFRNYPLMTMKDGNGRPSIRKKLVAKADNTFTVEEDIEIIFSPHLPARSQK